MTDVTISDKAGTDLDLFMEICLDLLCVANLDGHFVKLSHSWTTTLGWSEEELLARAFLEFVHVDDREATKAATQSLGEGNYLVQFVNRYRCKDGSYRWLSWNSRACADRGLIFAVARDVTSQRDTERLIMESERKFRAAVEASPFGMHMYILNDDEQLIFTEANPAADRILGIDHRALEGKNIVDAFPGLRANDVPDRYREVVNSGKPWHAEQTHYADEQIVGAYEVHAFQPSPRAVVAQFQDITERKKAEVALVAEKERLAVTLRCIGDGVIATDVKGNIVLMNKIAEGLTGWKIKDAQGKNVHEVFVLVDRSTRKTCPSPVEQVLANDHAVQLVDNAVLLSHDGREYRVADSAAPIRNQNSQMIGVVLVFRDITEQEKLENSMRDSQRLESLGVLAGGIAHDFNNLLGGIFGCIDLARCKIDDDSPAARHLDVALGVFERAKSLTQQLLTFSKGEQPVRKLLAIPELINKAVEFSLSGSSIRVVCEFAEDLRLITADRSQLSQVIDNLLLNAKQAMPDGGVVTVTATNVNESCHIPPDLPMGNYVKIVVSDEGTGISESHLSRIFDPFFTTKSSGNGLGLSVAYSIMKKHGGCIQVNSQVERGTAFSLILPAARDEKITEKASISCVSGGGNILVLDDESYICDAVSEMLCYLGFAVETASTAEEAVNCYRRALDEGHPFDVVILDLTIRGGAGGKECLAVLKEIDSNVRALAASGYSDDPIIAAPQEFGFWGSLKKPYSLAELSVTIREILSPVCTEVE